ncbi:TonB-linked outer membrane protein, SusC/RagA family [Chitinophaga costaii]|uniref:TonB-linked outer membrane protein, SusC/RagA family n=1 Tax=Chitinophaga costaii TaxID=1335309 RepID=A0A1C4FBQ0_9BACT|nr:SusC/RagA family TonB-linked outer membrane protein [Chitinophaga costaii]PUZ20724.1 SusC/RagA family TonB-linked outer membrane protein [Chitinophaga costaii]SCC53063.1 TonB-linked outer membrane protein, SusC/RagA family [Chitinophaga costaii]
MRKILLLLSCMLLVFAPALYAQVHPVNGKILDENGSPVPFASVKIKGTNSGTFADAKGIFTIPLKEGAVLVVSGIGYIPLQVTVNSNELAITLKTDVQSLNEVVVTGLGEATSRKRVPLDIGTLNAKNIAKTATVSIEQGLQGQIAGAQITQNNGQPGSGYNIILRGINNLISSDPMVLVDGVENKDLSSIDPSIVDHIEVAKGAAAGMLYGAQGANGVIQIFTKKGSRNQRPNITFATKMSSDKILRGDRSLVASKHHWKTDEQGNILNSEGDILKADANGYWEDPVEDLDVDASNDKPYLLPTYDHLKQGYRDALTFTNSLSITGGGNNFDYAFTGSRLDQQDVFSNKFNRTSLGVNLGIELAKGLTIRSSTQAILGFDDLLGGNRFNLVNSYPFIDFLHKDTTGMIVRKAKNENQLNSLSERQWHDRNNKSTKIYQNFNVNYKFPKFVELDFKYGYNVRNADNYSFYHNQESAVTTELYWGPSIDGAITDYYTRNTYQNALTSLFFRTDFKQDFHLNVPIRTTTQAVYDWRAEDNRFFYAQGVGLPTFPPYNLTVANTKTVSDNNSSGYNYSTRTFGFLVNQSIDFAEWIGISGGFRSDYSSEFGAGSKATTFPRGTIYIRPSEFMKLSWLSDWKLRGAFATAGTPPDVYTRQVTLDAGTLGVGGVSLSIPSTAHNNDLKIQVSKELEVGTDISVLPTTGDWLSRITLGATYWKRKSTDAIQVADVAQSTGASGLISNLTTLSSHGVDLSLDITTANKKNFIWNTAVRWGFTKTMVDKVSNHQTVVSGEFGLKEGEELGIFYGQSPLHSLDQLKVDGKTPYIDPADRSNYTLVNGNVVDTRTNAAKLTAADDLKKIGQAYPDFTASLINTFTIFQAFTVSFQFDWTHGNNTYNLTRQWMYRDKISRDYDDVINVNGKSGAYAAYYSSMYNTLQPQSWYVEDGSFIRLRDVSLTYDATRLIHARWLKRLSVTLGGRNLLTFTKYHGLDPETTTSVDSQGSSLDGVGAFKGVDYFTVPNLKSYQVGINVGF